MIVSSLHQNGGNEYHVPHIPHRIIPHVPILMYRSRHASHADCRYDDLQLQELAKHWIEYQFAWERDGAGCDDTLRLQWVYDRVDKMIRNNPEDTWKLVLAIHRLDQSECIQQILSAGIFEDLMSAHGARLIDRVEEEVGRDPSFADVIRGIYRLNMTDDIWSRLQRMRR